MQMNPASTPEENLAALGLSLPQPPALGGNYVPAKQVGCVLYLSGVISGRMASSQALPAPTAPSRMATRQRRLAR